MERRVAIIGAGASGLLACKYTLEKGFRPIVFEAEGSIGGVWTRTMESTKLQNTREAYCFSDFPWPSYVREVNPSSTQVKEYIESYAHNFGLLPYIKFNSKVTGIDYVGESESEMQSWELWVEQASHLAPRGNGTSTSSTLENSPRTLSGLPNIPEFIPGRGPEVYPGKVIHSMDYSAMNNADAAKLIKGKRIAIVGSQKSAVDIAAECANANGVNCPCTMIQRSIHWMFPAYHVWGVNLALLYFNRFSELLVHKPGETFLHSILATLLSTLRWGISKFVESYLRWKLPLNKRGMIPKHSFHQDVSSCKIVVLPEKFYDKVDEGSILLKKSQSFSFCREGLVINGENEPLKTDLIILATGYKGDEKLKRMFLSPTFQRCITSTVPFYRQIIHPRIPRLAVIGYSESLSNVHNSEIRCQWLAHFLHGTFELPSIKAMERDVLMWENCMKLYAGRSYSRSCIGGLHIWCNDQLCRDIGCNPRRKKGFFSELFEPYGPRDYAGLEPQ